MKRLFQISMLASMMLVPVLLPAQQPKKTHPKKAAKPAAKKSEESGIITHSANANTVTDINQSSKQTGTSSKMEKNGGKENMASKDDDRKKPVKKVTK